MAERRCQNRKCKTRKKAVRIVLDHDALQALLSPSVGILCGYLADWTGFHTETALEYLEKA